MSLERIVSDVFNVPEASVVDDLEFMDIASWDSLSHMMLIGRLEDDFKIQFSGDDIADMRSVRDARRSLQALGVSA